MAATPPRAPSVKPSGDTLTLPQLSLRLGLTVDRLRLLRRRHSIVQKFFTTVGCTPVIPATMVPEIRATLLALGESLGSCSERANSFPTSSAP